MLEAIQLLTRGNIQIKNANKQIIFEKHNDVQPFAKEAVTQLLAGNQNYRPYFIEVYDPTEVAVLRMVIDRINLVSQQQVEYGILIPDTNTITNIWGLKLLTETEQVFSHALDLGLIKPVGESLSINWTITIT